MEEHEIAALEARVAPLIARMEEAASSWREATAAWLAVEWRDAVERAIARNPSQVKTLASQGDLASVKQGVDQLMASASAVVEEELGSDGLWSHRSENPEAEDRSYSMQGLRPPDGLDEPIRRALGRLGDLLLAAGLDEDPGHRSNYTKTPTGYRWAISYSWSQTMIERMAAYAELNNELKDISKRVAQGRSDKASAEARSLWDNA
jgi:hypothetical protein